MVVSFGDFAFDQERRQLLRLGEPVPLETKAYELLGLLLSRRPTALSKAQIRDVLWPGTVTVWSPQFLDATGRTPVTGDETDL